MNANVNTRDAVSGSALGLRIRSALFEIHARDPETGPRVMLWVISFLFCALLIWACFAKLDIVAVAQGRLVPETYVKIVQPAEGGIVREILVVEGDHVKKGQIVVRLDPTVSFSDSTATSRELNLQQLQLRRIESELQTNDFVRSEQDDPLLFAQVTAQRTSHLQSFLDATAQEDAAHERATKELVAAQELLKKLEDSLPSYQRAGKAYEKLAVEGLVGMLQAEEKQREALEKGQDVESQRATVLSLAATISQSTQRLAQLKSAYLNDLNSQRIEAVSAITRLEQQLRKLAFQQGLLELRAPESGVVKDLATTTIGAVVEPGTVFLSLVPQNEPLLAEVQIENQDIGFVVEQQNVRVKIAAYQFQKYGLMEGTVKTISADATSAKQGGESTSETSSPMFKVLIELKDQRLKVKGESFPLAAGMQLSAEIMQGKRTVMEYLLSPVRGIFSEAAMER